MNTPLSFVAPRPLGHQLGASQHYTPPTGVPLGEIEIRASEAGLTWVGFVTDASDNARPSALTRHCAQQLDAYFAGELTHFDLPLAPAGTDFQRQVWQALTRIGFGETRSYAEQAQAIGRPSATRAVGAANGRNPLAIVVPCHRVIGANGRLTGYAGGLERKRWLLAHEGHAIAN
ncbi:methylated-DNA--[protein]-cysteine S-methyltransferase [Salinicola endophyticus]|uniref:Methylated-DNA--protein-cysteine methyltransferase n=1 Tax=Salinicola endophyticus TaxID=1949083 RepID=A0ABY8FJN8_9GAMM|nr:methylated-DNA--[protein]-cysteine S-methyltransferase [Salinicola endophyticus]WFF43018.1 methylated-DNA--[protein]-cysteine S-methyltransferase [Salinicola endophyticus]